MFCKLNSYTLIGITPIKVDVEVDLSDGLPSFDIVGLPDSAVKESKERVKSALKNSGFNFPICKITINLAPADVRKEGSLYDLPIALGILCASGILKASTMQGIFFAGELSLDGHLRQTRGLVPIICSAHHDAITKCIVPSTNHDELQFIQHIPIFYCNHLTEVVTYLSTDKIPPIPSTYSDISSESTTTLDFFDVKGQESIKRGFIIAAAGFHNILIIGPPGSGKTMLAKRLPYIMPPLSDEEKLDITKIYSVSDKIPKKHWITTRPFRSPHHTISEHGLAGGGRNPKPGEISLSHLGVLFLDELLEFKKQSLELLRQPLEDGEITISRVNQTITYPSNFLLVASTNPCPCGYYPNLQRCRCDYPSIKRYMSKLSGPLLDRISIQLELQPVSFSSFDEKNNLSSEDMFELVENAYKRQLARYKDEPFNYNSHIPQNKLSKYCPLTPSAKELIDTWFQTMGASARGYAHLLKLSRTIADINGCDMIDDLAVSEAISYRVLDRNLFA